MAYNQNCLFKNTACLFTLPVRYLNAATFVRKTRYFEPIKKDNQKPELYYSFEERMAEKNKHFQDMGKLNKHNIGFAPRKLDSNSIEKRHFLLSLKDNIELEKGAQECTLKIDLHEVEQEWISSLKHNHVKVLAEHYNIFKDLFGKYAFFYPLVNMKIQYAFDDTTVSPVYAGNLLKPKETSAAPNIEYKCKPDSLWTIILTNPDGNLLDNESEILHWFIGNIPGGVLNMGEEIVDYMQPIPPKGTGFHRYCFILYKQTQRIDYSSYQKKAPCHALKERTFKTYDFYKQHEDIITPAGLAWFQADYDSTLSDFFHLVLQMKEPLYEYEFPKPYIRPAFLFPHLKPFNRYMNLHRDPKETQKLLLLKRLARVHPFKGEKLLLPFPHAMPIDPELPIWLKNEIQYERAGERQYRDVYRGDDRPYINKGKKTFGPRVV